MRSIEFPSVFGVIVNGETYVWHIHDMSTFAEFRVGAAQMVREIHKPIARVVRDLGIGAGVLGA